MSQLSVPMEVLSAFLKQGLVVVVQGPRKVFLAFLKNSLTFLKIY